MFDEITKVKFNGKIYEQQHGNAFDRGSADSYYDRAPNPHKGGVGGNSGPRTDKLSAAEVEAYHAGYAYNEQLSDKKNYD